MAAASPSSVCLLDLLWSVFASGGLRASTSAGPGWMGGGFFGGGRRGPRQRRLAGESPGIGLNHTRHSPRLVGAAQVHLAFPGHRAAFLISPVPISPSATQPPWPDPNLVLAAHYCLLSAGCWLLAAGCWLRLPPCSSAPSPRLSIRSPHRCFTPPYDPNVKGRAIADHVTHRGSVEAASALADGPDAKRLVIAQRASNCVCVCIVCVCVATSPNRTRPAGAGKRGTLISASRTATSHTKPTIILLFVLHHTQSSPAAHVQPHTTTSPVRHSGQALRGCQACGCRGRGHVTQRTR
ncbi:hypothetical protein ANO11243_024650 [Dothideomycetidae sp. 11243]|nr:hypothetical protein ANO11243_024650 [fungal sp. No.11243]